MSKPGWHDSWLASFDLKRHSKTKTYFSPKSKSWYSVAIDYLWLVSHLKESGLNGHKINNVSHIESNNKRSAGVIHTNLKSGERQLHQRWIEKCLDFLIIPKRCNFQCFRALVVYSYWGNIMLPTDNWCDNVKCVVYTLLRLDEVLSNVYRSFGHTSVITYWCVDNYGYQLWQTDLYCIDGKHLTL